MQKFKKIIENEIIKAQEEFEESGFVKKRNKINYDNNWEGALTYVRDLINKFWDTANDATKFILNAIDGSCGELFRIVPSGMMYAKSKKYPHARMSIALPKIIADENIGTINDWQMFGIAIKTKDFEEMIKELNKNDKNKETEQKSDKGNRKN